MNDDFLKRRLHRIVRRHLWLGLWRKLALCWIVAAAVAALVVVVQRQTGWQSALMFPLLAALGAAAATATIIFHYEKRPDFRWAAQKIEDAHPELEGVLLTAVQQESAPGTAPSYLQHRVVQEATRRSQQADWHAVVPRRHIWWAQAAHLLALGCFIVALLAIRVDFISGKVERGSWIGIDGVEVSPGDASIERGDSLVVLARFTRTLPPSVSLVTHAEGVPNRAIPLTKSLADPVFGGSVAEIAKDFTYHLEYRGNRTREFKVSVFEHPRLVRADVDLKFPEYTKLPAKHIEDTRRVSAVEGTKLDYALQLNKPVRSAKLIARDSKKTEIPLTVTPDRAVASLPDFVPEKTQTYDLHLIDHDGRANKVASSFVIDVQSNRPPELKLASPRGDIRPSALEEISFDGTVWDDFGAPAYGLAYTVAGRDTKFVELGKNAGPKEKRSFDYTLKLEDLGAKPDDLVSWYVWADDVGPDGKVRRTNGDLYFAEVRPFDEVFRESQMPSDDDQQGQQGGQQGNQRRRLTELQKQIINATWKLQRDGTTPKYPTDAKVVTDSQQQVMEQAIGQAANARSPRETGLWKEATQHMDTALQKLHDAAKSPSPLAQALPEEQAAYQSLLKLQARETAVTRGRQRGGGGAGGQMNQRQIDQLDLQQERNRYETQRQARAPQAQQRTEELAVMNRLQELARRQQDLNERLKELQTSLQEARTEQEKDEVRRRLKRLEEEQRQMLADADEVRQRMDRPDNQSNMSQERQQLDETRSDLQRAADAAGQGSVAQALASGTRAQRSLQDIRDQMRKENSSQFADDLREMRSEARDLARQQDDLTQKLDALDQADSQRKSLSDSGDRQKVAEQLDQQKEKMNKLLDRAQQVSEQAENVEPLLSKELYDSIRRLSQTDTDTIKQARQDAFNGGNFSRDLLERLQKAAEAEGNGKALDLTRDLLREGNLSQAKQIGQRARSEVDELRRGVERAAESVLGDDTEQLKLAQSELDQLTDALKREIAQAQNGDKPGTPSGAPGTRDGRQASNQPGNGEGRQPSDQPANREGRQAANESGDRGASPNEQAGGQRGAGRNREAQANNSAAGQGSEGQSDAQSPGGGGRGGGGNQRDRVAQNGQPGERNPGGPRGRGTLSLDNVMNGGANNANGGNGGAWSNAWNGGAYGGWMGGNWDGRSGPLTGDYFGPWTDRLTDVEQLVDSPELRNALQLARERARLLRRDFTQDRKKPDWAVVQLQVIKPLVEVRDRVAEELARRDAKDSLAPIDRDPVPNRFAESVRRYYEELGKDRQEATR